MVEESQAYKVNFNRAEASGRRLPVEEAEQPQLILIVDDNDINRMLLSRMLAKKGFRLLEASNGKEAIKMAMEELP
ncbi:MAG: hypothetical protein DRG83_08295, partial [Deltaproteobacteria bacterium]